MLLTGASSGRLTLMEGDFLAATPAVTGLFSAVWDRGGVTSVPQGSLDTYAGLACAPPPPSKSHPGHDWQCTVPLPVPGVGCAVSLEKYVWSCCHPSSSCFVVFIWLPQVCARAGRAVLAPCCRPAGVHVCGGRAGLCPGIWADPGPCGGCFHCSGVRSSSALACHR